MFVMKKVRKRYGDFICRRCINRQFHVKLQPKDCHYGYMYHCPCCKQPHHIVVDLTASGKLKTLFK